MNTRINKIESIITEAQYMLDGLAFFINYSHIHIAHNTVDLVSDWSAEIIVSSDGYYSEMSHPSMFEHYKYLGVDLDFNDSSIYMDEDGTIWEIDEIVDDGAITQNDVDYYGVFWATLVPGLSYKLYLEFHDEMNEKNHTFYPYPSEDAFKASYNEIYG